MDDWPESRSARIEVAERAWRLLLVTAHLQAAPRHSGEAAPKNPGGNMAKVMKSTDSPSLEAARPAVARSRRVSLSNIHRDREGARGD